MPIETGHSLNNFRENIKAIWRSEHNNNVQNEFMISIHLEIKHQPNVQDLRDTTDCRRQFIQTSDYQRHHSIIGEVKDKSHQPHIPSRDILKKADHCENESRWIDHEIITDRIMFMHSIWYNQNVNVYIWIYSKILAIVSSPLWNSAT